MSNDSAVPTPKKGILDIVPYKAGESKIEGKETVIKLASNESPLGPSPKACAAMKDALTGLGRYPEPSAAILRNAVADLHEIDPDLVVGGNGSEQLLQMVVKGFVSPGDEVVQTEHAFVIYRLATMAAAGKPVFAPVRDLTADVDAILKAVTDRTKIVFIDNPGNPTGTWIDAEQLSRLRRELPDHILLVIDAAYAEYLDNEPDYSDGHFLVDAAIQSGRENVAVTHTFSKVYGLAGLRLGWIYAPPSIIDVINRVRDAFNVNMLAQLAGVAALGDKEHTRKAIELNATELPRVAKALDELGFTCPASGANFVLPDFGSKHRAEAADAHLREQGVIVRPVANYGLPEYLRITIGTPEENDALIAGLKSFGDG